MEGEYFEIRGESNADRFIVIQYKPMADAAAAAARMVEEMKSEMEAAIGMKRKESIKYCKISCWRRGKWKSKTKVIPTMVTIYEIKTVKEQWERYSPR